MAATGVTPPAILAEFKAEVARQLVERELDRDHNPDEATAQRYYRARKEDLAAAVKQYIDAEEFFRQRIPDDMLDADPLEVLYRATCPHANLNFDTGGRPVYVEHTGRVDMNKVLKYLSPADLLHRHMRQQQWAIKRMEDSSKHHGKLIEDQVIIMDMKGLSLWPNTTAMSVFKLILGIDQAHYPERLFTTFILNAPWIFSGIWAVVRPWMDDKTKDKFHVYGGSGYEEALFNVVEPQYIPVEYGGTYECEEVFTLNDLTPEQQAAAQARLVRLKAAGADGQNELNPGGFNESELATMGMTSHSTALSPCGVHHQEWLAKWGSASGKGKEKKAPKPKAKVEAEEWC